MNEAKRKPHLLIFLISFSLISLEVVWTRLLSAEFFYTFAFLILSLAVLGLGLGGLAVRFFPGLQSTKALGHVLLTTALLALLGPLCALRIDIEFSRIAVSAAVAGKLLLVVLILCSAFLSGGIAIASLFRLAHADMPRLYRADLIGASLGVLLSIALMNYVGTPATVLLLPLPLLLAAMLCLKGRVRLLCVAPLLLCLGLLPWSEAIVMKPRQERLPVIERHWDSMALVKVQQGEGYINLNIDNAANTPVNEFDGDWAKLKEQSSAFFLDPRPLMVEQGASVRFLSLGSGGGGDVLMALNNGASEVHAVEVNAFINGLLIKGGSLSAYSGRLYSDQRVRVVTEDARCYLRRHPGEFDIVYSLSSNTFAALASGAFALAENYLFTTEAFRDAYGALSERGFIIMEHQFYVPRLVTEAIEGLRLCGVQEPEKHIAVYTLPQYRRQVLLIGRKPLTEKQLSHAFLALEAGDFKLMHRAYPNPDPKVDPNMDKIVRLGWQSVQASVPTDLSPADDNRPFAAQQGLLKNFSGENLKKLDAMEYRGFPVAKLLIAVVIGLSLLVALPLNLLPLLKKGPRLGGYGWSYFFLIGAGFMVVEVVLLQQFTLLVGPSAYTMAVLLFTLLLCSGIGSRFSGKVGKHLPFVGILLWLALDILFFKACADRLFVLSLWGRMAGAALMLAPLGFFMGMPFPKGTERVGALVDWGFAVNGMASVLGSASVLLIAFNYGFRAALVVGGLLYAGAWLLLLQRAWRQADSA